MVDATNAFEGPLFSRYPQAWVINSDRDFQQFAENFAGQFQWLLETSSSGSTDTGSVEIAQALASSDGGQWTKVREFGGDVGQLYRWVPDRGNR
jgi:hypothetical protein